VAQRKSITTFRHTYDALQKGSAPSGELNPEKRKSGKRFGTSFCMNERLVSTTCFLRPYAIVRRLIYMATVMYLCAFALRIAVRKYYLFLPDYARWAMRRTEPSVAAAARTHVFFVVVDHFEPKADRALVRRWIDQ